MSKLLFPETESHYATSASPPRPVAVLYDSFTTDESAPLTSPRTCEPGPGSVTIASTLSSIADGTYIVPAGDTTYAPVQFATTAPPGTALIVSVTIDAASTGAVAFIGFGDTLGNGVSVDGLAGHLQSQFDLASFYAAGSGTTKAVIAQAAKGSVVDVAVIRVATDVTAVAFRYDDGNWRLGMIGPGPAYASTVYAQVGCYNPAGQPDIGINRIAALDFTDHLNQSPAGTDWSDPYGLAIVRDTFTDSDETSIELHLPETGGAWTEDPGFANCKIIGNELVAAPGIGLAIQDTGTTDHLIIATVGTNGSSEGIMARYVDYNNCLFLYTLSGTAYLYEYAPGVTLRGSAVVSDGDGERLIIRCEGADIRAFHVSPTGVYTLVAAYTATALLSATKVALQCASNGINGFTDVSVYPIDVTDSMPTVLDFPDPPAPTPVLLLSDTFTDTEGTSMEDHTPDTRGLSVGTWVRPGFAVIRPQILSNQAGVTYNASNIGYSELDLGMTEYYIQATFTDPRHACGIMLRFVDVYNWWWMAGYGPSNNSVPTVYRLFEAYEDPTPTGSTRAEYSGAIAAGDVLRAKVTSTGITFWVNSTMVTTGEYASTVGNTSTKIGLRFYGTSPSIKVDDLKVWSLAAVPDGWPS